MGLYKQLLLGSAAVLAAAAGAQAADLPSRKAAPVEYVRICDAYGAGFFYIPGTDTCVRLGGYLRTEYDGAPGHSLRSVSTGAITQVGSDQDQSGTEMRGRIDVDARQQTNWGTVQTVVELRGTNTDGIRNTAASTNFVTSINPGGNSSSTLTMERAYIRFAGITAGVGSENVSTIPPWIYASNTYAGFPNGIKQLAYTAVFGGGFSATIAMEARGDFGYNNPGAGTVPSPSAVATSAPSTYVNHWDTGYNLVGNVRFDQSWGFVQLGGGIGNDSVTCNTSGATVGTTPAGVCQTANNPLLGPKEIGSWAIVPSFAINLPMIAPGDVVHFQFGYGHGFNGLVESQGGMSDISDASNKRVLGGVIRADSNLVPTSVTSTGGVLGYGETNAWAEDLLITHYWTPNWRSNLAIEYAHMSPPTASCSTVTAGVCVQNGGLNTQWGKGDLWAIPFNLIWSPVKNFDIGIEIQYVNVSSKLQNPSTAFVAAGEPGLKQDGFNYHIRLERTF